MKTFHVVGVFFAIAACVVACGTSDEATRLFQDTPDSASGGGGQAGSAGQAGSDSGVTAGQGGTGGQAGSNSGGTAGQGGSGGTVEVPDSGVDEDANVIDSPEGEPDVTVPPKECNSGEMGCNGPIPWTCGVDGKKQNGDACPTGCINGYCAECQPSLYRCDGLNAQQCDSNGQWKTLKVCQVECTASPAFVSCTGKYCCVQGMTGGVGCGNIDPSYCPPIVNQCGDQTMCCTLHGCSCNAKPGAEITCGG